MQRSISLSNLYGQFSQLTNAQIQYPLQVLDDFCNDFSYMQLETAMKAMVEACLTSDNPAYNTPSQRSELLNRHKRIEQLLQAVFVVAIQRTSNREARSSLYI